MGRYLGTKFFEHDSTVFLIDTTKKDLFGISTERITRIKHDPKSILPIKKEYPHIFKNINAVASCFSLDHREYRINKLKILFEKELAYNVCKPKYIKEYKEYIDKVRSGFIPKLTFTIKGSTDRNLYRLFNSVIADYGTKWNKSLNDKVGGKILDGIMKDTFDKKEIEYKGHHLCHAASSYYFSPFNEEDAIAFTLDGKGVSLHSSLWKFSKNDYVLLSKSANIDRPKKEVPDTISIGILYSIFTKVLGFRPLSDEGKVEALAAFGKPNKDLLKEINQLFKINKETLSWDIDEKMTEKFTEEYLKKKADKLGREDFSSTIQHFLDETVVEYLNLVYDKYKIKNLCLSGGVCANVIMNLNIFERTKFKNIYIFPAMGDDGAACGAAILAALDKGEDLTWLKDHFMPYFGPKMKKTEIDEELKKDKWKNKITFKRLFYKDKVEIAARYIKQNKIISLVQGRMEFGPRALGNRSILANPRNKKTQERINSTVKRRPSFQPFCPSVLEDERSRLFEKSYDHKHMAIAFRLKKKYYKDLPSAIHVDGTARPQFVSKEDNRLYYDILKQLKKINGYGVTINTSFNLHGRTIVRTPEDAITDFIDCNIDAMILEDYLIERK